MIASVIGVSPRETRLVGFIMAISRQFTPTKKSVPSKHHNVKYATRIAFIAHHSLDFHDDSFLVARTKFDLTTAILASEEGVSFVW